MLLQGGCASTGVSITYDNEIHLITSVRYNHNDNVGPNPNPHYYLIILYNIVIIIIDIQ